MPRSWQEVFFERLVTVSRQTGDPRLASTKLHPRKKTASFTHPEVRWIECVFDTNRISGDLDSQVLVVECAAKRGTDIDGSLLEREFKQAQIGGDVKIDESLVVLQYRWGYGRDEPFPLHDPRRINEVIDWTYAALRVLFGHLEKQRNVVTVTEASGDETGASVDFTLALEKYLEDFLVEGWDSLGWTAPLQYLGRQVPCGDLGFIDILAKDRGTGDFVVIELKRDRTDDEVVGQLSRYMGWIKEHRAGPTGVSVRSIIVVHEVTPKLRAAALAHDNVQLYTYNLAIALHPVALPGRSHTDTTTC
jgi:Endonuclease NucS